MIEKHSATQSSALSDLQSELKSLKTLLLSRQNIPSTSTTSPPSGTNGSVESNTNNAANALLGKGRSIPAWQMGPSKSESGSEGEGKGKEKEKGGA
jgi:peroxin-14